MEAFLRPVIDSCQSDGEFFVDKYQPVAVDQLKITNTCFDVINICTSQINDISSVNTEYDKKCRSQFTVHTHN